MLNNYLALIVSSFILTSCNILLSAKPLPFLPVELSKNITNKGLIDHSTYSKIVNKQYNIAALSALDKQLLNNRASIINTLLYKKITNLRAKYSFIKKPIRSSNSLTQLDLLHADYGYLPLLLPLNKPKILSPFAEYRKRKNNKNRRIKSYYHKGIDLKAYSQKDIYAAGNGIVEFKGKQNGYGNVIIVRHHSAIKTLYAHLSSMQVQIGQQVTRGQILGKQGATGNARGEHLHFEVRINGVAVEPLHFINTFY